MTRRAASVCLILAAVGAACAADTDELWQRIEDVRYADVELRVVDGLGQPIPGAEVTVTPRRTEVRFGCNLFLWGRCGDPQLEQQYRARFAEVFDLATLPFYWWSYEREQGETQADYIRQVRAWCRDQRITPKGHPLFWNHQDPRWLPDDIAECARLALERVGETATAFGATAPDKGYIRMWDVVNEAANFERCMDKAPKLTQAWQQVGQIEMVRRAFAQARQAQPHETWTWLINDYDTSEKYERVIRELCAPDGSYPFNAIGIQSHMHNGAWSTDKIRDVCKRFGAFGLPLHFTEITILSGEHGWHRPPPWKSTPEGEQRQAEELTRLYLELLAQPQVQAIIWWDLSDKGAWMGAPAGLLRADMTPKPAFHALKGIRQRLLGEPRELTSDAAGRCAVRLPHGYFQVTYQIGEHESEKGIGVISAGTDPAVFELKFLHLHEGGAKREPDNEKD